MLPEFDITTIPVEEIPATLAILGGWLTQLAARQMTPVKAEVAPEVRLLTVDETAAKLSVLPEWLYKRAKALGAIKLGPGTLAFLRPRSTPT
jgi:hypothetical protein